MRPVWLILGLLLTTGTTLAAIASMVVPRATRHGLAHAVSTSVLAAMRAPLRVTRSYRAQDRWLRLTGPISVLAQLAVFVFLVIVGIAMVIYGQYDLTWKQSAWQAAATVTTLGTTEAVNWSSAMSAAVGAFLGLVIIAVFMGYLVGLYSSYVARESLMARFAQVAGEPAWGPMVLARSQALYGDATAALDCDEWTGWMTDVRIGQQASPVLAHFRSPDPLRHWSITTLAILDATALALALDLAPSRGSSIRCVAAGTLMLAVLDRKSLTEEWRNWEIERRLLELLDSPQTTGSNRPSSLDDDEWAMAVELLVGAGVTDGDRLERARHTFEAIRSMYVDDAMTIARSLHGVRAPWSGERSFTGAVLRPQMTLSSSTGPAAR